MSGVSDEAFPVEPYLEDGQQIGFTRNDLCGAVELWAHAQSVAVDEVTLGAAALAFNVSPQLLWDGFKERDNPFFWVRDGEGSLEGLTFDVDGY